MVVFLSGFTFAFIEAPALGWSSPVVVTMASLGVIGLAVFLAWERRTASPMLPLSVFAQRQFAAVNAVAFHRVRGADRGDVPAAGDAAGRIGLLAAVTITNPAREHRDAAVSEQCLHCGLDAPPLTASSDRRILAIRPRG